MATKTSKIALCIVAAVAVLAATGAAVDIRGNLIDALTGYTVNGAAPTGEVICGNGTVGVFSATCAINVTTATNVFGSRSLAVTYQNTNTAKLTVYASFARTGSYGQDSAVTCEIGSTSGSLAFFSTAGIHNAGGQATTSCIVPAGWFYQLFQDNTDLQNPQPPTLTAWWEVVN